MDPSTLFNLDPVFPTNVYLCDGDNGKMSSNLSGIILSLCIELKSVHFPVYLIVYRKTWHICNYWKLKAPGIENFIIWKMVLKSSWKYFVFRATNDLERRCAKNKTKKKSWEERKQRQDKKKKAEEKGEKLRIQQWRHTLWKEKKQ